jgi:hypothetical protein
VADQAIQWIDPAGTVTALRAGTDSAAMEGREGRFGPPPLFELERVPLQPGQRFRNVVHGSAVVHVPVAFYGSTATALRTSLRKWARLLDPIRGDGTLRVTGPGGDTRDLVCRYTGGLDTAIESDYSDLANKFTVILMFTTEQPYWQDSSDTVAGPWVTGTAATFFPFFPLVLSDSTVFASVTVDNTASDAEAWPVWTIRGPGANPILRNLSSTKFLSLPITLAIGDVVTIDTRPGQKTIIKQDGSSLFGSLTSTSSLWSLLASTVNSIRIEMSSATAASQVQMNFRHRYLSA